MLLMPLLHKMLPLWGGYSVVTIFSASFCLQLANANVWPSDAKTHPDTGVTYMIQELGLELGF